MKHLAHVLVTVAIVATAAVPAILADPSFAHYVASHPWATAYLPLAAGVLKAIASAIVKAKTGSNDGASLEAR